MTYDPSWNLIKQPVATSTIQGSYPELVLTDTGVSPGVYGSASTIPQLHIDHYGRVVGVDEFPVSATGDGLPTELVSIDVPDTTWTMTGGDVGKHYVMSLSTGHCTVQLPGGVPDGSRIAITVKNATSGAIYVTLVADNHNAYLRASQAVQHTSNQRRVVLLADNSIGLVYRHSSWYPYHENYASPLSENTVHRMMRRSDGYPIVVGGRVHIGRVGHILRLQWVFNGTSYGVPTTLASDDFFLMEIPYSLQPWFYHPTSPSVVLVDFHPSVGFPLPVIPTSGPFVSASPVVGFGILHDGNWVSGASPRAFVQVMPYMARHASPTGKYVFVFNFVSGVVDPPVSYSFPFPWGIGHPTVVLPLPTPIYGFVSIDIPCYL